MWRATSKKPPYLWPKTPFTSGRKVQTEEKILRFRKYPDTCGRGLRLHPYNINRDSGIEIPEAWISMIKKHKRKTVQQRTAKETASR